jgi:EmrB/QacA subfamily drug resistance transporter
MKKYGVLIVVSLAMFILTLDTTMMNVAITAIAQDLDTEIQNIQLAVSLYALIMAAFMITGAKLADMYGTKRIFLIGTVMYGVGTLIAALSQNIGMLIAGWSIIEGLGAALMMPAIATFLMVSYKGKERMTAFAVFTAVAVGGAAIGPIVGGAFTTYASWRWAFASEAVIVVIVLAFSYLLISQKKPVKPKLDWFGVVLSAAGMACLVYGLILTTNYGWWNAKRPFVIGGLEIAPFGISFAAILMIAGIIFLLLFVVWLIRQERRGNEPLAPTSLFKNKPYIAGNTVFLMLQLCIAAMLFTIPFFLQSVLFKSAIESGIALMPLTLAMLVFVFVTSRLASRFPVKYLVIIGAIICVAGTILLANSFSVDMSVIDMLPGLIVIGIGLGLANSQLQNLILSSTKGDVADEASGLMNSFRNLGTSMGTAVVVSLLLTFLFSSLVSGINDSNVLPEEDKQMWNVVLTDTIKHMEKEEFADLVKEIVADYPDEYVEELQGISDDSIANSMRISYYVIAGIFGISLATSLLLPRRKLVSASGDSSEDSEEVDKQS